MRSTRLGLLATVLFSLSFGAAAGCGSSSATSPSPGGTGNDAGASGNDAGANGGGPDASSEGGGGPVDGSSGGDGGSFVEATHRPFPQLIASGGPLLTAPKVVTVTFKGEANAAQLEAFGATVTQSAWWDAVRAGYCLGTTPCVGQGPAGTKVEIATAAAATYTDGPAGSSTIKTFIDAQITSGTFPKPDANTLYVLYFPTTTTITSGGGQSCANGGFDGYHDQMTSGGTTFAYAIVAECTSGSSAISTLQNTTITASHEIIEAATDPFATNTTGGYYLDTANDLDTLGWNDIGGGEVGDMCVDYFGLGNDVTTEGTFDVQRIWSNPAAASGHDPCVPVPNGEVYFNAAPKVAFFATDVGKSVTFEVDAFSDGPRGDWVLSTYDATTSSSNQSYLSFSISGATTGDAGPQVNVNNGSKVQVTVTLLADPGPTTNGEADGMLVSSDGDPTTASVIHFWPFAVMSNADAADAGIDAAAAANRPIHLPIPRAHAPRVQLLGGSHRLSR